MASIPFIDLAAQRRRLGTRIDAAIGRVLEHGRFILGPEVAELERALGRKTYELEIAGKLLREWE